MAKPTVAIVGASMDRSKYGNKSVRAHLAAGYDVYPVNRRADEIEGLKVYRSVQEIPSALTRVSMYVPPEVGLKLLDEIAEAQPEEVFFNPGSESDVLLAKARQLGLPARAACSIVDLGLSPRQFPDQ